ncbi:MAG: nitroreductase family protein [Candidatus Bathyarchaeota archaeon]|nr:MAG: nitroreductase family protein [Candidatus Bathyarchaeota archaeon]
MEVFEAIRARRSVRSYKSDLVPEEVLMRLLEAARLAPSAMNYQPWRFIVVRRQEVKERIARSGMFARFASQAPVIIVACGDTRSRFHVHDTCIALEHIVLAATSEGMGSCWIGSFDEEELRGLLKIPERFSVVALVSIGYAGKARDLSRTFLHLFRTTKRMEEVAFHEEFGAPLGGP